MNLPLNRLGSSALASEFRTLALDIALYYKRFGVEVYPFHDPGLPHFSRLSADRQRIAIRYLNQIWGVTQDHVFNQVDAKNNESALWSALKVCGLKPTNDLFGYLEADDKIEVYSLDGIQLWRNCNVMKICSYSIEEMHSYEWQDRYERSPEDNHRILQAIKKMLETERPQHISAMIPWHVVKEKFSIDRLKLNVRHDHFFPLKTRSGDVAAFLVTSKVEILQKEAMPPLWAKETLRKDRRA